MADLRCPMCAKMNPDTLDECQFCGARLKPLILPQTGALKLPPDWDKPKPPESASALESNELSDSDWLKSLRGEGAASASTPSAEPFKQTASLPDWLGMKDEASPEPEQAAPGVDDWLSRLRDQDSAGFQQAEEPEPLSDDLLRSRLGDLSGAPPPEPEASIPNWLKPESSSAESDDDWLKPLGQESQAPSQVPGLSDFARMAAASPPQEEDDSDEWLKSFGPAPAEPAKPRGFSNWPAASASAEPAASDEDDTDTWLKSFGAQPEQPKPQPGLADFARMAAAPPPQEEDDSGDWLKMFGGEQTPAAEKSSETELPAWLKTDESKPPTPPAQPPLQQTASLPEWLGTTPEAAKAGPPPTGEVKDDAADWLKSLSGASAPAASGDSSALPDWLNNLTSSSAPPSDQPPSALSRTATLDWLKAEEPQATPSEPGPTPPPAAQPSSESNLPDWLSKLTSSSAPPSDQPPSALTRTATLDWLKAEEASAPSQPASDLTPAELPDWLSQLTAPPSDQSPPALSRTATLDWLNENQPAEATDADLPDWLKPVSPPSAAQPPSSPELPEPDWVISADSAPAAEPATPPSPKKSTGMLHQAADTFSMQSPTGTGPALVGSEDEMQEWLKSLEPGEPAISEPSPAPGVDQSAEAPEWLSQIQSSEPSAPASGAPALVFDASEQPPAGAPGELPEWLASLRPSDLEAAPPFSTGVDAGKLEAAAPGELPAEMPAWLAPAAGAAASAVPFSEPVEGTGPGGADLARGTLPSWLQAMRPIDLSAPTIDLAPEYEETAGPLAGMRGILPAESAITVPGKPGAVVTRFVVSDVEAQQAELLRSIVSEETQESAAAPKRKPRFNYNYLVRLFVALALVVVALMPYALGSITPAMFALPASLPPSGEALYNEVEQLPLDQPVLIAFEYEPASTGELNPGVEAVMAHLMQRGVPVAVVSTSPAGSGVAQDVLNRVAAQVGLPPEDAGKKYFNLGYIPGGAAGLQQFALDLPALAITNRFSNFNLIIVATATAESAQAWLEQVQPAAGVKMAAIASAAAEPMLYPYYKSDQKQLAALVSGLSGGVLYGAKSGRAAPAEQWNAYAYGLNVSGAIITLGAVAGVVMLLMNRRPAGPGAARIKAEPAPEESAEPPSELKRRKSKKPQAGKSSKARKKK